MKNSNRTVVGVYMGFILFILVVAAFSASLQCKMADMPDEEKTDIVRPKPMNLKYDDAKPYVIDPINRKKIYVSDTADTYEDAAGFIWDLV